MKCLETRKRPDGLTRRRYRTDDGRTVATVEIPASVLRAFSQARLQTELEKFRRGEEIRARRVVVEARLARGVKPTAIAHEVGLSDTRIRQIRKGLEK